MADKGEPCGLWNFHNATHGNIHEQFLRLAGRAKDGEGINYVSCLFRFIKVVDNM